MKFFVPKKDKFYLLVVDSTTRAGNLFKIQETWMLVWSAVVTEEFLENPDWEWEPIEKDASRFPGGWPKEP